MIRETKAQLKMRQWISDNGEISTANRMSHQMQKIGHLKRKNKSLQTQIENLLSKNNLK
jgi:hypothetical protein